MSRPFDPQDVLFLIPAYNEEGNLGAVLDELRTEFPAATLLVIDDGSADRTAAVARAYQAVVIKLPFNMGIGAAIQTGIADALAEGFRCARLDGDGQYDPVGIHRFSSIPPAAGDLLIDPCFRPRRFSILLAECRHRPPADSDADGISTDAIVSICTATEPCGASADLLIPDDYPEPEVIIMAYKWNMCVAQVPATMRERLAGISRSITFCAPGITW